MEFQKERCFTALNADELRAGDKVIVANSPYYLKQQVLEDDVTDEIVDITTDTDDKRFRVDRSGAFALAYLVERKENCTNCEHKWEPSCSKKNWPIEAVKLFRCVDYEHENEQKAEQNCEDCENNVKRMAKVYCSYTLEPTEKVCDKFRIKTEPTYKWVNYRPFKDTDELIKVWLEKGSKWQKRELTMPLIWVRDKEDGAVELITMFGTNEVFTREYTDLNGLFDEYEFLDGSPCGVEE